jgi:hypothetical protein
MRTATTACTANRQTLCLQTRIPQIRIPCDINTDVLRTVKTLLFLVGALIAGSMAAPVEAQIYSPRKLTERIAPLLPPPPANTVARAIPAPPPRALFQPVNSSRPTPAASKPLAEDPAAAHANGPESATTDIDRAPLTVQCTRLKPDPEESLQTIDLCLSNTGSKAVSRVTLHLVYCNEAGEKLKEWTTRREMDQPLSAKAKLELSQPAYFMPFVTRRVKVQVLGARFTDGTEWPPTPR